MKKYFLIIGIAAAAFSSCKKEEEAGTGSIMVRMTDAPAAYQQVNVDIQQVEVHLVPASGNGQWISLPTKAGIYDLLTLQNGIDTSIVALTQLPTGKITQMRLILGPNNSVMENNVVSPLTVPSGSQTGIKIPGPIPVIANSTLSVLIDFDAAKSVSQQGNGDYQMKPVIQVL
jgi:hypothetical protein